MLVLTVRDGVEYKAPPKNIEVCNRSWRRRRECFRRDLRCSRCRSLETNGFCGDRDHPRYPWTSRSRKIRAGEMDDVGDRGGSTPSSFWCQTRSRADIEMQVWSEIHPFVVWRGGGKCRKWVWEVGKGKRWNA